MPDFWRFENSAESKEATLYIYGDIVTYDLGRYNWPDDVVPNKFKDELNELGDVDKIHVRINSGGGSVFAAYAIMNLLKSHKASIVTYNDGIAASAATIIAMAGDKIVSALGSIWMIHLPAVVVWDRLTAKELDKLKNMLETIAASMIEIYNHRTGIEKAELEKLLEDETWMTGAEAFEKGFVDEVTDLEIEAKIDVGGNAAFFNGVTVSLDSVVNKAALVAMLSPMKSAKNDTGAVATANPLKEPQQSEDINNSTNNEEDNMTLDTLKAEHPDLYNELYNKGVEDGKKQGVTDGVAQGVAAERERIMEIDALALPGMDELTNKAKYETGVTAANFALEVVKAQKEKGANFLKNSIADADEAGEIPAAGASQDSDEQERAALLAHAKKRAEAKRRGG